MTKQRSRLTSQHFHSQPRVTFLPFEPRLSFPLQLVNPKFEGTAIVRKTYKNKQKSLLDSLHESLWLEVIMCSIFFEKEKKCLEIASLT